MASGVSACLATPFKIHGVNYSISSACATSAHCIGNAVERIQLGNRTSCLLAAAKSCAGKWLANSTQWVRCLLNTTTPRKKPPVLTTLDRDGFVIAAAAVW
ncbi:beta-ketoacyl synthase N-terminal-like domain-containing protein [Shigella flexneri]